MDIPYHSEIKWTVAHISAESMLSEKLNSVYPQNSPQLVSFIDCQRGGLLGNVSFERFVACL